MPTPLIEVLERTTEAIVRPLEADAINPSGINELSQDANIDALKATHRSQLEFLRLHVETRIKLLEQRNAITPTPELQATIKNLNVLVASLDRNGIRPPPPLVIAPVATTVNTATGAPAETITNPEAVSQERIPLWKYAVGAVGIYAGWQILKRTVQGASENAGNIADGVGKVLKWTIGTGAAVTGLYFLLKWWNPELAEKIRSYMPESVRQYIPQAVTPEEAKKKAEAEKKNAEVTKKNAEVAGKLTEELAKAISALPAGNLLTSPVQNATVGGINIAIGNNAIKINNKTLSIQATSQWLSTTRYESWWTIIPHAVEREGQNIKLKCNHPITGQPMEIPVTAAEFSLALVDLSQGRRHDFTHNGYRVSLIAQ